MLRLIKNYMLRRPFNSSTEVRVTFQCTQRCLQCAIPSKNSHTMSVDEFHHVMRELKFYGAYVGFISGGEATLVDGLTEMLKSARKTFSIATTLVTGLYHREDVIEKTARVCMDEGVNLQTSFDGLGETGDEIRGVKNFSSVVSDRMKMIADIRKSVPKNKNR